MTFVSAILLPEASGDVRVGWSTIAPEKLWPILDHLAGERSLASEERNVPQ
jgi:hypothetical protein